ncbi:MAG: dimethyl sulfoxide reductase anchor subunit [Roseovarius sp.]|nr:dimethyl sulfoxide reductase anchor subunit [Roseovarius sp.]MCY4208689.1 dimethyl sulfoxide reductase anchor subunit [Roseovarius sp.]
MHPTPSIIIFTTLSGLGFGLLFWLGIGMPPVTGWEAFAYYFAAFALAAGGLVSSTFHLGRPERALKAFTQWSTSWLSREGICAVAALLVFGINAAGAVFWNVRVPVLGYIGSVLALGTVFATSMIYAQLNTVPLWKTHLTPVLFLLASIAGGALLGAHALISAMLLPVAALVQAIWWMRGDRIRNEMETTIETATGLGNAGKVRSFEPPHTGANYLLREFAFEVGRKNARRLRMIALTLAYTLPFFAIILAPDHWHVLAVPTAVVHLAGVAVARWLFFAEAVHVVGHYYGRR